IGLATVVAATFILAATPASGQRALLASLSIAEPVQQGLAVTGTLSGFVATSSARIVVPTAWRRAGGRRGGLAFSTVQNPRCSYDLAYSVKSVLAPIGDAAQYVAARLPGSGPR